eukprot:4396726-Pleurochrysis_carterae.AAC.1
MGCTEFRDRGLAKRTPPPPQETRLSGTLRTLLGAVDDEHVGLRDELLERLSPPDAVLALGARVVDIEQHGTLPLIRCDAVQHGDFWRINGIGGIDFGDLGAVPA